LARIGNDEAHVDGDRTAEAAALGAGAERTVERKQVRRRLAVADRARRTFELGREALPSARADPRRSALVWKEEAHVPFAEVGGLLERIDDALALRGARHHSIGDDVEGF